MKNSKYVHSYYIQKYESGIISIIFNTTERWIGYHRFSDTEFSFYIDDDTVSETENIQEIPEFLENSKYMKTSVQDKDQVIFYYIPFELIMKGEIIFQS